MGYKIKKKTKLDVTLISWTPKEWLVISPVIMLLQSSSHSDSLLDETRTRYCLVSQKGELTTFCAESTLFALRQSQLNGQQILS